MIVVMLGATSAMAQVAKDYDPQKQRTSALQYFKPAKSHLFTGDCMPYYHDGMFYIYWLLDEGHHAGLGGFGGHQWALSTSEDLVNWTHYPMAIGIDEDWEKSICTGSVIADNGRFYAFYSTRVLDDNGTHEHLSYAISDDGKDFDGAIWGGNMLLREVVQEPDGTLDTKFLEEALPQIHSIPLPRLETSGDNASAAFSADGIHTINASNGTGIASISDLPVDYRKIELNSNKESAFIYNTGINTVKGLDHTVKVDIILKDEFIDMNIDGRRSIVNRLPEKKGHKLFFFLKNGNVRFHNITLSKWHEKDW